MTLTFDEVVDSIADDESFTDKDMKYLVRVMPSLYGKYRLFIGKIATIRRQRLERRERDKQETLQEIICSFPDLDMSDDQALALGALRDRWKYCRVVYQDQHDRCIMTRCWNDCEAVAMVIGIEKDGYTHS